MGPSRSLHELVVASTCCLGVYPHTLIPSYPHTPTLIPSYPHTIIPSYHHTHHLHAHFLPCQCQCQGELLSLEIQQRCLITTMGQMLIPTMMVSTQDNKIERELYIGNIPGGTVREELIAFLNNIFATMKLNTMPGDPIIGARIKNPTDRFAFIEIRSNDETANLATGLHNVEYLGCVLRVRRPASYEVLDTPPPPPPPPPPPQSTHPLRFFVVNSIDTYSLLPPSLSLSLSLSLRAPNNNITTLPFLPCRMKSCVLSFPMLSLSLFVHAIAIATLQP
jgi:hypothetical protein